MREYFRQFRIAVPPFRLNEEQHPSGAKQAAEKGSFFLHGGQENLPQGLKPYAFNWLYRHD
jgi:hypothetical protein